MKKTAILLCLLTLALAACKPEPEPTPNNGGQNNDTTETVVKKYLVKELLNDDPEKIRLAIDWNDDCTRILHAKYGTGNGYTVDYDFKYYGNDSIRIIISLLPDSYPLWKLWYDSVTVHQHNNLIDSISCYDEGNIRHKEYYSYDDNHRIIERKFLFGTTDTFCWEGDNVVEACMYGVNYNFDLFTNYIHPHHNLPFYLSNFVALEIYAPMFTPFWKFQPVNNSFDFEADEDNYVVKAKSKKTETFYTFYYITKTK